MTYCAVKGCHNASHKKDKDKKITFHLFPSNPIAAARWINRIRLNRSEDCWKPTKHTRICSEHFDDKEKYTTKTGLCKLRQDAVPTKGLHICCKDVSHISDDDLYEPHDLDKTQLGTSSNKANENNPTIKCNEAQASNKPAASATSQKKQRFDPLIEYANDSTDEESSDIKQERSDEETSDDNKSESGATATDKVFVKSIAYNDKRFEDGQKQSKRARLDSSEYPLDYTEELYEFGKFVAEQLMCLDVEDARVAQAEIRALLSKFDVNKIMRCLAEPSTSNVQPATDEHRTVVTQVNPVVLSATQSGSEVNTAQSSLTQPVISHVYTTNTQMKQLVLMPMNTDRSSATQSGLQVNTPGPSGAKSGQIFAPSLTKFAALNVNTSASSTAPIGYVIEPKTTGSKLNLTTQCGSTERKFKPKPTSVTQAVSETSIGPAVTQIGSTLVISTGSDLEPESASSSMTFDETLIKIEPESEPLHSHVNIILPNLEDNQNLLVIKHEQDSEEET